MAPRDRVLAGVIYDPVHDDLYRAALGQGARRNDQAITVSQVSDLEDSVIGFDWSRSPAGQRALLASLGAIAPQAHTIRGVGSAALALAWIGVGRLDGYFNFGLKAWDAAAGQLLISEAGGVLTTLAGTPWRAASSGCLAGNQDIHQRLLPLLELPAS
jgi:myo-inositol-1(or 4)-monophosphatase